jgi:nucleotide-binding universal stress UspA family protein
MKRILFPTDFSEVASNAFVYALEFAKLVQGELIVLHSYDLLPMDSQFFPENFNEVYDSIELTNFDLFKEEIPKLRAIMEKHKAEHIKMTHRLLEGDLVANIKKSIIEDKIDCVIMGTSGVTEWESLFAGSNSGSVILGIDVPVFCVPLGVKFKRINTIGFVNHYKPQDKIALNAVLALAKKINAKIKCLYIKTSNSDIDVKTIEEWEDEFSPEHIAFFVIQSDEVKQVIQDFISYQDIDVLTMLTYKSSFFVDIFVPNYAKKPVSDIDIPILVIHV